MKRISTRFNDRTIMLLNELSKMTETKISVVIRSMVDKCIDELIDKEGNWKLNDKRNKKKNSE